MSKESMTARSEITGLPCVVIDRDEAGNNVVYADRDVLVIGHNSGVNEGPFCMETPAPIPEGWLDTPEAFNNLDWTSEAHELFVARAVNGLIDETEPLVAKAKQLQAEAQKHSDQCGQLLDEAELIVTQAEKQIDQIGSLMAVAKKVSDRLELNEH